MPSWEERFWSKVSIYWDAECWPWTAGLMGRMGYGNFSVGGRNRAAHRVAWESANGESIPDGKFVCHRCDNPVCCNPAHLFLGTHADNMRDARTKGRLRGNRRLEWGNRCQRGHEQTPANVYVDAKGDHLCRICREERMRKSSAIRSAKRKAKRLAAAHNRGEGR